MRAAVLVSLALLGCYQAHELGVDAGPRPDVGPMPDTGNVSCGEETIPAFVGPRCSESVNACRDACAVMDEACRDACLDASCRACRFQTIFHCANAAGCETLWRSFACCVESVPMCSALRGFERSGCASSCPGQFQPYVQCIETTGGMPCFMQVAADCGLRSP